MSPVPNESVRHVPTSGRRGSDGDRQCSRIPWPNKIRLSFPLERDSFWLSNYSYGASGIVSLGRQLKSSLAVILKDITNSTGWVFCRSWPSVEYRIRAMARVRAVQIKVTDGVEFLSLPPLRYHRGKAKPFVRAVWGGLRQVSLYTQV